MEIYLVGGAVRDQLLGEPVKERDWVVVGGSAEQLLAQGFKQVGKDFPVFLHPKTGEEYALARTERKTARGYTGFSCDASPQVTLEDDLQRRDLTINAMAQTEEGNIIDPFSGQCDLEQKILRHVSPAFVEDPLRVLRVARFAARLAQFDFKIADETQQLMRDIVAQAELNDLPPERIWQEFNLTLNYDHPDVFIKTLVECGAWSLLFPQINSEQAQLEILQRAVQLSKMLVVRFAALLLPASLSDNEAAKQNFNTFCQHYPVPRHYQQLTLLAIQHQHTCRNAQQLSANELLNLFKETDAIRRPKRFHELLLVYQAHDNIYPAKEFLIKVLDIVAETDIKPLVAQGLKGIDLQHAIVQERLKQLQQWLTKQ